MKIAFVFFPDFTLLDVVGVYDPIWRLKDQCTSLPEFMEADAVIENEVLVDDGSVITAGAVAASITLGLYLCERLADEVAMLKVKKSMGL